MSEFTLKEAIIEAHGLELESFEGQPGHRFSLRHRIKMKHILSLCERNIRKTGRPAYKFTRRRALIAVMIVLLAAIALTAAVLVTDSFRVKRFRDHTELFALDTAGAPSAIGNDLYRAALPDGYELIYEESVRGLHDVTYMNLAAGKWFMLCQAAKEMFVGYYDGDAYFEKTEVNGRSALYTQECYNDQYNTIVLWDNGDYILEASGNMHKDELLLLAESAKIPNK